MSDGPTPVLIQVMLGCVKLETRFRPEGRDLIGEGRALHYDGTGALIKDTGWEPTGIKLIAPPEEPKRPWWKLW